MENNKREQAVKLLFSCGIKKPETIHRLTERGHIKGSLRTVQRDVHDLNEGIDIEKHDTSKMGRPHKLTEETKMEIEEMLEEDPYLNSVQIVHKANLDCNPRTVRNFLQEEGYKWRPVKSSFLLDPKHFPARFKFAKTHMQNSWLDTLFLDEATFRLNSSCSYCYQKEGQKVAYSKPKYCSKVNACAAISVHGPTRLFTFRENMDAELFKKILIDSILPDCRALCGRGYKIAWDQDSKHTSSVVKTFLNSRHVNRLEDFPPSSPDINPIEQIWGILKQALKAYRPQPTKVEGLEIILHQLWKEKISRDLCRSIILTMPDRMIKLSKCKGRKIEEK